VPASGINVYDTSTGSVSVGRIIVGVDTSPSPASYVAPSSGGQLSDGRWIGVSCAGVQGTGIKVLRGGSVFIEVSGTVAKGDSVYVQMSGTPGVVQNTNAGGAVQLPGATFSEAGPLYGANTALVKFA